MDQKRINSKKYFTSGFFSDKMVNILFLPFRAINKLKPRIRKRSKMKEFSTT
jgi:hypothetical protein